MKLDGNLTAPWWSWNPIELSVGMAFCWTFWIVAGVAAILVLMKVFAFLVVLFAPKEGK
jgi:hypothetical protein